MLVTLQRLKLVVLLIQRAIKMSKPIGDPWWLKYIDEPWKQYVIVAIVTILIGLGTAYAEGMFDYNWSQHFY